MLKTYIATVQHDNGTTLMNVKAESPERAIEIICKSENCPQSAISNIEQVKHTRAYLIPVDQLGDEKQHDELTDEEFMMLAAEEGRIYTLENFVIAFNSEEVSDTYFWLRIIHD
jgi:hypothetical protein